MNLANEHRLIYEIEPYWYRRHREQLVMNPSPRIHRYPHPGTDAFENEVADSTKVLYQDLGLSELQGRLGIECDFYVSNRKGDVDNYGKALVDGITRMKKRWKLALFNDDNMFDYMLFRRYFVGKGAEGIITRVGGIDVDNGYKRMNYPSPFGFSIPLEEDIF